MGVVSSKTSLAREHGDGGGLSPLLVSGIRATDTDLGS